MDINQDDCPICKDRLQFPHKENIHLGSDTFILTTPCNHHYHTKCIKEWFNMGNDGCPKCSRVTNWDELFCANVHIKMQILQKFSKQCKIRMQRSLMTPRELIAANARDAEEKAKAAKAAEEAKKIAQEEKEIREGGER